MLTQREKLIQYLDTHCIDSYGELESWQVVDFIIEDRNRIVAPLVKWDELDKIQMTCNGQLNSLWEAKTEVLALAMLDKE